MIFLLSVVTLFGFYALLAFGLGLIFGQLNVVNLAYGGFAVMGAYSLVMLSGIPFVLAVIFALVIGGIIAALTERYVLRALYEKGYLATLLAMWGVSLMIQQAAQAEFGATPRSVSAPVHGTMVIFGTQYPTYRLVAAAVALVIVAACLVALYRTRLGLRLRAAIDNRDMAAILGVRPGLMISGTFIFGSVLAVFAGILQAPLLGLTPDLGITFLAPAFFAVLIGGLGSLWGPLAGAFVISVLSTFLQTNLSNTTANVALNLILILLIGIWPRGLEIRRFKWKYRKINQLPVGAYGGVEK